MGQTKVGEQIQSGVSRYLSITESNSWSHVDSCTLQFAPSKTSVTCVLKERHSLLVGCRLVRVPRAQEPLLVTNFLANHSEANCARLHGPILCRSSDCGEIDHKFILWESLFTAKAERSRRIEATLSFVHHTGELCNSLN